MVDSATDRKSLNEKRKRAKLVEQRRLETIHSIMDTRGGREFVLGILESCHIFADPFSGDALLEAFKKGERNVGLMILNDIMRSSTDEYVQMMRERNERDSSTEDRDDDDSGTGGEHPGSEEPRGYLAEPRDPPTGADIYREEEA